MQSLKEISEKLEHLNQLALVYSATDWVRYQQIKEETRKLEMLWLDLYSQE